MFYLGIDIAKNTHYAALMTQDGHVLIEPFSFSNDINGFNLLLSSIKDYDKEMLIIGLESTAHYAENLISFLFDRNFKIAVINPIQTASVRKSSIRKVKTDKVDTLVIIKTLLLCGYSIITSRDISLIQLKSLCLARHDLVKLRSRSKVQLTTYIDQLFPEFQYFFKSGLHINTSYRILEKHSLPSEISNLHLTYLTNLLEKSSRMKFSKQYAINLKRLASNSVGINNPMLSVRISNAIEQIELFSKQIKQIEDLIADLMQKIDSTILSIPGIGTISAANILAIIGDISRFPSASQLVAFAGLDPVVVQSGNFTASNTRMSKRGSRLLRYTLIFSAHNVAKNNTTFNKYYNLKRSQGKSHYNALGHVANKLVRIIHKILSCNICFDLD
jgi:transposase